MSIEQDKVKSTSEELTKSIDSLIDELFSESIEKGSAIDIAGDADKTADGAISKAPKGQQDSARGAGRPKQISDVPQKDMDGRRDSEYDASISENEGKEDEPDEAKKQAQSIDQTSGKGRIKSSSKAPKVRPFKKSEDESELEEISEEEYKEFQEFKKAKTEAADKALQEEELKKAQDAKKEQEDLLKSVVESALSGVRKENEELRKSFQESQALLKAMASQPQQPKSITSIEVVEKSEGSTEKSGPEAFSKSEILDAAEELAKSGKIDSLIVSEIEMTNRCSDDASRDKIEKFLEEKK